MRIPELWRMSGRAGQLPVVDEQPGHTRNDRILALVAPALFVALVVGWGLAAGWWGR